MKIVVIVVILLVLAFLLSFVVLGFMSRTGEAPGIVEGRLSRCPDKPNCVCTEHQDDHQHFVDPIIITQKLTTNSLPILNKIINEMGGTIHTEKSNYLAATFSSAIFGFVDDLEIRLDTETSTIHIRSASRVGYGDAGVNKKRAELLKALLNKKNEPNY